MIFKKYLFFNHIFYEYNYPILVFKDIFTIFSFNSKILLRIIKNIIVTCIFFKNIKYCHMICKNLKTMNKILWAINHNYSTGHDCGSQKLHPYFNVLFIALFFSIYVNQCSCHFFHDFIGDRIIFFRSKHFKKVGRLWKN